MEIEKRNKITCVLQYEIPKKTLYAYKLHVMMDITIEGMTTSYQWERT
jgi:hypothetical protein